MKVASFFSVINNETAAIEMDYTMLLLEVASFDAVLNVPS